jgi:hypothetical protein
MDLEAAALVTKSHEIEALKALLAHHDDELRKLSRQHLQHMVPEHELCEARHELKRLKSSWKRFVKNS